MGYLEMEYQNDLKKHYKIKVIIRKVLKILYDKKNQVKDC